MKLSQCCVGILAVVAAVLGFANLVVEPSSEGWSLFQQYNGLNSLLSESERKMELDRQLAEAIERNETKERIAARIEAGQLTLFEAAVIFAQLDEKWPGSQLFLQMVSGASEEEKHCRLVIRWMDLRAAYSQSDEEAERIRQRLEAELQEHLDRNGGVVELPDDGAFASRD